MYKILILFSLAFFSLSGVHAQDYENLLLLFVDEDFEKCFDKAVKYTENGKTKDHPLPYLYAAKAAFAMSRDNKYKDSHPKAYNECLSYLAKYRKIDRSFMYKEEAIPFFEKLKLNALEEIENEIMASTEKSFKNASGLLKKINKFDSECIGTILLWGVCETAAKNTSDGKKYIQEGLEKLKEIGSSTQFGDLTLSQHLYLKKAIIEYALSVQERSAEEAKEIISLGHPYFYEKRDDSEIEDWSDFIETYDAITNTSGSSK